jgi:hypothetical protein
MAEGSKATRIAAREKALAGWARFAAKFEVIRVPKRLLANRELRKLKTLHVPGGICEGTSSLLGSPCIRRRKILPDAEIEAG